jgi:hypothetical protein
MMEYPYMVEYLCDGLRWYVIDDRALSPRKREEQGEMKESSKNGAFSVSSAPAYIHILLIICASIALLH